MSRYVIFIFLILYELYIFTREIFKIFLYTCPLSIHNLFYASKGIMYNFSKITVLRYCCCTSSYLIFKMNELVKVLVCNISNLHTNTLQNKKKSRYVRKNKILNGSRKTFRAYFRILIYMHFQCLLYLLFFPSVVR